MAGLNKVMLIGNLGADPEVRYTQGGNCVANMRIAVTTRFKGKDGEWNEDTQWINIVVWGKQAENAGQYLAKGRSIYVEGKMKNRSWDDKEGNKRWVTEVQAQSIIYLGEKSSGGEQKKEVDKPKPDADKPKSGGEFDSEFSSGPSGASIDDDDDIPF